MHVNHLYCCNLFIAETCVSASDCILDAHVRLEMNISLNGFFMIVSFMCFVMDIRFEEGQECTAPKLDVLKRKFIQ